VAPTDQPSENEDRLRFVANAVPALLAYLDTSARYVWANETYRRWFDHAPEKIRGRHISEVLGETAWEQLRPHIERALQGEEVTFETRIDYRNGGPRDIRASYSPHLDSRGKVRGSCPTTSARSGPRSERCAGANTCWNARSPPPTSAAGK
jgi:PAS domain S-box-containing protein